MFSRPKLLLVFALIGLAFARPAQAIETAAKQAIIIDYQTGGILFEKNADELMPPSSMSKMMTVHMVFERLKNGSLNLSDTLPVSERAWRMGGSKMFVMVGSRVSVEDLLKGVIIQSGNDACVVLAEGLGGSEEAFAEEMTRKGKAIGLKNSTFRNSTGWPDDNHLTTARDLATLASSTIANYPEYYRMYSEVNFTYGGITQGNRNPLLYKNLGSDGLKTGHTEIAGYGLTASAIRDGRRLIMVLNGMKSMKERAEESERLIEWAFREFDNYPLFKAGEMVVEAPVWLGAEKKVSLLIDRNLTLTLPRKARPGMKVVAQFDGPIPAPIKKGTPLGRLVVTAPETKTLEIPLVAANDVEPLGVIGRLQAAVSYLIWGPNG